MNKPALDKAKFAILSVSLLLLTVLALAAVEMVSLLRQGWSSWLLEWSRPLIIFVFTVLALYLLNGRSEYATKWLQNYRIPMLIPLLKELIRNQKLREDNRMVTERMDVTLDFYRLMVLDELVEPPADVAPLGLRIWQRRLRPWLRRLRRGQPEKAQPLLSSKDRVVEMMPLEVIKEEDRICNCVDLLLMCGVVTNSDRRLSRSQLCLLYREQHGLETVVLYAGIRANCQQRQELSKRLLDSEQLPNRRPGRPFSADEAADLLKEMDDFDLVGLQDRLLARQQQIAAYQKVVDRMFHTVEYFGLEKPVGVDDVLVDDAPNSDDSDIMLSHCALAVGIRLMQPADVLELLYRDLYDLENKALFDRMEKPELSQLAQVLVDSGRLPERRPGQPFSTDEAVDVFEEMNDFKLAGRADSQQQPKRPGRPFTEDEVAELLEEMDDFDLVGLQDRLLARQQQIAVYQKVIDKMFHTVDYFGLKKPVDPYDVLVDDAPNSDDRDVMLSHCASAMGTRPEQPADVLELLYRDLYELETRALFERIEKSILPLLARVLLLDSSLLPERRPGQPFSADDVADVYEEMDDLTRAGLADSKQLPERWSGQPFSTDEAVDVFEEMNDFKLAGRADSQQQPKRPGRPFTEDEVADVLDVLKEMGDFELAGLQERLLARQQQIAAYQKVVDKMFHTVDYFGLKKPVDPYDVLVDGAPNSDDRDVMLSHCASAMGTRPEQPADALELLYRDLYELETKALFERIEETELSQLAQVLVDSGRLPERRPGQFFSASRVARQLRDLSRFSLMILQNQLLDRQREINAYKSVVDRMDEILPYFQLATLKGVKDGLVDDAPTNNDPDVMLAHCAQSVAKHLHKSAGLLELLYREYYKHPSSAGWVNLIPELADVLVGNPNLPAKVPKPGQSLNQPFNQQEICRALKQLPFFSMEKLVDRLLVDDAGQRQGLAILRRMESTLNYYQIFRRLEKQYKKGPAAQNGSSSFSSVFQQDYLSRLPKQFDAQVYTSRCAATVAENLEPGQALPSAREVVELIYHEHSGEDTDAFWKNCSSLRPGLAMVLIDSAKLPEPELTFPYGAHELEKILAPHEDFSLSFIRDEIDHLGVLSRLADKYQDFLRANEIDGQRLDAAKLLDLVGPLPAEQWQLKHLSDKALDVLIWYGTMIIQDSFKAIKREISSEYELGGVEVPPEKEILAGNVGLQKVFCHVSLAIFLSYEPDSRSKELLSQVCKAMYGDKYAARIGLALVDLAADLDEQQQGEDKDFVTIKALIKNWRQRDKHLQETFKGYDKEIRSLNEVFRGGEWLNRLAKTLKETLRKLSVESAKVKGLAENRQQLRESLRRVYMRLDVRTIERYLEARTIVAYLIAFDSTKGSLAGLLDSFMLQTEQIEAETNDKKRQVLEEQYKTLQELGIHLQDKKGRRMYNFCQYTFNTRIGVLPTGWTLSEFHEILREDMMAITRSEPAQKAILAPNYAWSDKGDLEATEMIMHRFGLRNHYSLKLDSRSEKAVQNMKYLFATQVKFDDLVATISYEHLNQDSVADAIIVGPIAELGCDKDMHGMERSKLLKRDLALKISFLLRLGLGDLTVRELEILKVALSKEQIKQIAGKLQQPVLANALERIIRRHTSLQLASKREALVSALLQYVQETIESDKSLRFLQEPIEQWPTAENTAYPWTEIAAVGDTLKLAILNETECLVLDPFTEPNDPEPELELLDVGIKAMSQRLVESDGEIDKMGVTLTEAMVDLVPQINVKRLRTIAGTYLTTLWDVARLGEKDRRNSHFTTDYTSLSLVDS